MKIKNNATDQIQIHSSNGTNSEDGPATIIINETASGEIEIHFDSIYHRKLVSFHCQVGSMGLSLRVSKPLGTW